MHLCTFTAMALGVLILFLMSTRASSIPVIVCQRGQTIDGSQKMLLGSSGQTQCFLVDKVEPLSDGGEYVDARSPAFDRHIRAGAKRQDVDHVFLRFGRNLGL